MPRSSVEIVRAVVDSFNRGDFVAARALCAEDVEFDWSRRLLDGEVFHGHEGLRRFMEGALEIFDEIHIPSEDMTDLGDGLVLLAGRARFRGHTSGLSVEAYAANLWNVRDGKVCRFRFYQSKEEALADA